MDTSEPAYRSATAILIDRRDRCFEERADEIDRVDRSLGALYARRRARVVAGKVAMLGMAALVALGLVASVGDRVNALVQGALALALGQVVLLVALSYAVSVAAFKHALRDRLRETLSKSLDAMSDVRLMSRPVAELARSIVSAEERASLCWPALGAALMLPLTVHWVVVVACTGSFQLSEFSEWIALSLLLVTHAHIVFAVAVWSQTDRLVNDPFVSTGGAVIASVGRAVTAACIPGAILFAIPPILCAVTGVVVGALIFPAASRILERERLVLLTARAVG